MNQSLIPSDSKQDFGAIDFCYKTIGYTIRQFHSIHLIRLYKKVDRPHFCITTNKTQNELLKIWESLHSITWIRYWVLWLMKGRWGEGWRWRQTFNMKEESIMNASMGKKTSGEDNKIRREQKDWIFYFKKLNPPISFNSNQEISHFFNFIL